MNDDHHQQFKTVPNIDIVHAPLVEKHPQTQPKNFDLDRQSSKSKLKKLKYWLSERLTKKQLIIGAIVFILLLGSSIAFGLTRKVAAPQTPIVASKPKPLPPVIYTSPLSGLVVTKAQTNLPVTGVMIENSVFARPQSGLNAAGVVYEAIAEGGITRFLALYQETSPANVGPIRSARPYFLQWALGFDAAIAHVGGSPEALQDIKDWHVKDLDQFYNSASYHRVTSRVAPHNVYTGVSNLTDLEKTKGWTSSSFTGFTRKKDNPAKTPTATSVDFNISGADYNAHYAYTTDTNSYARSEGGTKHTDAETGGQLSPKVVIALVIPYSLEADGKHSNYGIVGSGTSYIFQDGTVSQGTWHKTAMTSQITFTDTSNKPIALNAGQTWITAVKTATDVTYKP